MTRPIHIPYLLMFLAAGSAQMAAQEFRKGCPREVFAGREIVQAAANCVVRFEDIAQSPSGELWIAYGHRALLFSDSFTAQTEAKAVLGKPGFDTIDPVDNPQCASGSDAVCWFNVANRLAVDPQGRAWVSTDQGLLRFSAPFGQNGSPADIVLPPRGNIFHLVADLDGNL